MRQSRRGRIYVSAIGMSLVVPAIFGVGNAGTLAIAVTFLLLFGLGWGFFDCNNMPILSQIVRPELRATGYGLMNFVSISCGGLADWGFGVLRDRQVPINVTFSAFATYRALARAANLIAGGVQAPPGADQDEFDPNIVVENTARANSMPSFGLFDRDLFLSPLRQLSFWKMKDRARQVGESGIHPLLVSMMQATSGRDVRVHLMGHSFGCIVASAAVAGPPGAPLLPRQVDSLSLVQGAFSLWAYCADRVTRCRS